MTGWVVKVAGRVRRMLMLKGGRIVMPDSFSPCFTVTCFCFHLQKRVSAERGKILMLESCPTCFIFICFFIFSYSKGGHSRAKRDS